MNKNEKKVPWIEQFMNNELSQRLKQLTPAQEREFLPFVWAGLADPEKSKTKATGEKSILQHVAEKLQASGTITKSSSFVETLTGSIAVHGLEGWNEFDKRAGEARASDVLAAFEQLMQRALREEASKIQIKKIIAGFNKRIMRLVKSKNELTSFTARQYLMMPQFVLMGLNVKASDVELLLD